MDIPNRVALRSETRPRVDGRLRPGSIRITAGKSVNRHISAARAGIVAGEQKCPGLREGDAVAVSVKRDRFEGFGSQPVGPHFEVNLPLAVRRIQPQDLPPSGMHVGPSAVQKVVPPIHPVTKPRVEAAPVGNQVHHLGATHVSAVGIGRAGFI